MAQPPPPPHRRRSWRVLLPLAALVLCLLLVAGLEGLLRLSGIGDIPPAQASKLRYQQVYPPMLSPGKRPDGVPALVTNDMRIPWQSVLADKPAGGLRVVAVGGSATAGLGFSPNVSFSRELERMLRAACPDRPIELLNLGVVALDSAQVRWVVDDVCRNAEPDVLLIYCGNNEFLELHAQKFLEAQGPAETGLADLLGDTNLYRSLGGLSRMAGRGRDVTVSDMAKAQARVSETEMVAVVQVSSAEHAAVIDAYETNLRAMIDSAERAGTGVVLMTVASNWEWGGRDDLPAGWIDELLGGRSPAGPADLETALARVDERLAAADDRDRSAWRFKRGRLLGRLGRWEPARDELRASMNEDLRLRRALDVQADRVRALAAERDVPCLDTIAMLAAADEHGIVGSRVFYDYVHFTPEGCARVAAALFDVLSSEEWVQPAPGFDAGAWLDDELAWFDGLQVDPLDVGRWLGVCDELGRIHDRDLWKHVAAMDALDAHLSAHPDDVQALVWRANADFFRLGGRADAERGYERALTLDPAHSAARDNLAKLRGARRP